MIISAPHTLTAALDASFALDPQRIVLESGERRVSASEVMQQAAHWAGALANFGVGRGDRVAVQVEKSVEVLFLYLGCLRLGAVYLPLNTAYRSAEVE